MTEKKNEKEKLLEDAIEASLDGVRLQELDDEDTGPKAKGETKLHAGTVVGVSDSDVIVELGPRSQGVVPREEFDEAPEVGSKVNVTIRGREDDLMLLSVKAARALSAWNDIEVGSVVKAKIIGLNKGGLEARVGSISAFVPASQVALRHVDDLAQFADQTMVCEVIEMNDERKRVVLSRRKVLEEEAELAREQGMGRLVEGAVVRGKVTRLESFGAFVDIGHGIEGLVHVSNMSYRRVQTADEMLKAGQEVEVMILEIKEGGRRIGLGMKQLESDPWEDVHLKFPVDTVFNGRVRRLTDFGAFIELVPGVEGLLHVSQLSDGHVRHAREFLKENEEITIRVTKMDTSARRVSLSRFDQNGILLGSDEAADAPLIQEVLEKEEKPIGTNLGDLFKKALKKDG